MVSFLNWQLSRLSNTGSKVWSMLRTLLKRAGSALLTAGIMGASVALILFSLGAIRVPYLNGSKADAVTVKPRIVSNSPVQACSSTASQTSPLFTTCPSFAVDYSGDMQGLISNSQFSTSTGPMTSNHEAEYYTGNPDNVRIENGNLVLEAKFQPTQGYKYTSGKVDTHGKEDFLYGKLVVRAQLPDSVGTWPAIWMLPSQPKYASLSPIGSSNRYLNDGEIDIAESVGLQPHLVYGVAHSVAYPEDGPDRSYYSTVTVPNNDSTFHDYGLEWTPTSLTFSIDGKPYYTYSKKAGANWQSWPYDQPFYLVVNLAMGGTWAGGDKKQFPGDGIDKRALPAELKVQSINYYSYVGAR